MRKTGPLVFLALLALMHAPFRVHSAEENGPPDTAQPAEGEEGYQITLSGVTLSSVIEFLSQQTGKPVLLPERFPGEAPVDVVSGAGVQVSREKAMGVFSGVLRKAGYTVLDRGGYIEIAPSGKADGLPVGEEAAAGLQSDAIRTVTVELKNADAQALTGVLTPLKSAAGKIQPYPDLNQLVITDHGVNVSAMRALIRQLDRSDGELTHRVYQAQQSSVETLHTVATDYLNSLKSQASPALKKRLEQFSITLNRPRNSLVLLGDPQDIPRIVKYIETFDVKPDESARQYHIYNVLNRDVDDLKQTLDAVLNASNPEGEVRGAAREPLEIIADAANSALILIATQPRYQELLPLLEDLDRPRAQVEIEAVLIEISTNRLMDIGIELNSIDGPSDDPRGFGGTTFGLSELTTAGRVPIPPTEGGLTAGIFKDEATKIAALVRASQKDEGISFVAGPRITTVDNKAASVTIAEKREFAKSILSPEAGTREITSGGFHEANINLEITPHINDEGTVRLKVLTEVDQFLPSTTTSEGIRLTNKTERTAETEVTVPDGNTVVFGGLTRTTKSKTVRAIPILGRIPILGALFRRTVETDEERHLCIFITPTVHRTAETMTAEARRRRQELADKAEEKGAMLPSEAVPTPEGRDENKTEE